jgi:hypothetical protein
MRRLIPAALLLLVSTGMCGAQVHTSKIALTTSSNVSTAEVGKSLDSHCPDVIVTADLGKAEYLLEAINTGAGPARKPYKFTLFNHDADRIFSTETARIDSAVKDVCGFIEKHKQ